jgi:hypothetical protein
MEDRMMTAKGLVVLSLAGAMLALGACATPEEPAQVSPAAPRSTAPGVPLPGPASPSPQAPAAQTPKAAQATAKPPHRQYLDQRTGRYYYFDQTSHRYYWEDGSPRY